MAVQPEPTDDIGPFARVCERTLDPLLERLRLRAEEPPRPRFVQVLLRPLRFIRLRFVALYYAAGRRLGRWEKAWRGLILFGAVEVAGGAPGLNSTLHPSEAAVFITGRPLDEAVAPLREVSARAADPVLPLLARNLPPDWAWAAAGVYLVVLLACLTVVCRNRRTGRFRLVAGAGAVGRLVSVLLVLHFVVTMFAGVIHGIRLLAFLPLIGLILSVALVIRILCGRNR